MATPSGMAGQGQAPPIRVPTHGLTRYLRATVEVTAGVVRWVVPRTLLGLVPIGNREVAVPIEQVEGIRVGKAIRPFRLATGLALAVVPWPYLPWWAAAVLLLLGIWVVLVALGPQLMLVTHNHKTHRTPVCFDHQLDAELYVAAVEDLVAASRRSE